ncbi:MAG: DNA primase [Chloroflexi bacterium HGW-Chloroflexi-5]|jgi:DNA primase|nr:MAG: DNA primase [Chloroflexi bacterium HGW-Chloroflexi-5]
MTAVDEIKARLDIVDIVSETVKLRRSGRSYTGFCPFHPNAKTPAFAVFPESGTWRCFGQCNEGGDIFKYMMKREGWDFAEALRRLAERAGVTLETFTPERKAAEDEYERLRELLEEAVNFYQFQLLKTPAGQPALDFLTRRGVKPETIQTFGLGYSPSGYDGMVNHFSAKGFSTDDLLAVGLVVPRESGGVYDKYRNRVMFPIRDAAGKMAGFGARILDPNDIPKFLNSPQTVLFDKSHLLYGLNFARKPIRAQDQVVIVEGYLDAIILHQAGFDNTVSPMGTALNEDQFRLLKKFTRRIVLALDADAAGEKATLRGLDLARNALDHETELTFDAHGLLRHEARLQADVRVTTIPDGMDPDEVVLRDPEEWRAILAAARPIVVHVMETLAKSQNLEDAKVKTAVAAQILPLIEDVPSPIERDTYRQQLARLLKVDERSLLGSQRVQQKPRRRAQRIDEPVQQRNPKQNEFGVDKRISNLEAHCLSLLLQQPHRYYELERTLKKCGLDTLGVTDFDSSDHQIIADALFKGLSQDEHETIHFVQENIPESLAERLTQLSGVGIITEKNEDKLFEDLVRSLINLRLIRINALLNQIRFIQSDEETAELDKTDLHSLTLNYTIARGKLDMALAKPVDSI